MQVLENVNISVVDTGYVGLVTGTVFADLGNDVVRVGSVATKVAILQAGRMPIYEPGLEETVARYAADTRLRLPIDLRRPSIFAEAGPLVGLSVDPQGHPRYQQRAEATGVVT